MANPVLGYWYRLYTKQTPAEVILESLICKLKMRYRTQHIVMSCNAILDFYFPDYNLALEVDDPGHLKPKQVAKDKERTDKLLAKGIRVIRCTNDDVFSRPGHVIQLLEEYISRPYTSATLSKLPLPPSSTHHE